MSLNCINLSEMSKLIMMIAVPLMMHQYGMAQSGTIKVAKPDIPAERITATVANQSGGFIRKNQLLAAEIVMVNDTTEVLTYEFSMTYASVKTHLTIEGNKITPDIKLFIDKLRAGQIIRFKNIMCRDNNGLMFRVYDIQFEIIN